MLYMVISRVTYALPIIIYGFLNIDAIVGQAFNYAVLWATLFLSTLVFSGLGKFNPCLIAHVTFLAESFFLFQMGNVTGDANWFLLILLSSYFAVEALRNEALHIMLHLSMLAGVAYIIFKAANIGISSYVLSASVPYILLSPLICRCIMSALEARDVVIQRIVKRTKIAVPSPNEEKLRKAAKENARRADMFESESAEMLEKVKKLEGETEVLKNKLSDQRASNAIDEDIVKRYFMLCSEPIPKDRGMDEKINKTLLLALKVVDAEYVAFVAKEGEEVFLSNSVGKNVDEDAFVEAFSSRIYTALDNRKIVFAKGLETMPFNFKCVYFVPVCNGKESLGVLIAGTKKDANAHYGNLAFALGCRLLH